MAKESTVLPTPTGPGWCEFYPGNGDGLGYFSPLVLCGCVPAMARATMHLLGEEIRLPEAVELVCGPAGESTRLQDCTRLSDLRVQGNGSLYA
jgi:hypothetical protein